MLDMSVMGNSTKTTNIVNPDALIDQLEYGLISPLAIEFPAVSIFLLEVGQHALSSIEWNWEDEIRKSTRSK